MKARARLGSELVELVGYSDSLLLLLTTILQLDRIAAIHSLKEDCANKIENLNSFGCCLSYLSLSRVSGVDSSQSTLPQSI